MRIEHAMEVGFYIRVYSPDCNKYFAGAKNFGIYGSGFG